MATCSWPMENGDMLEFAIYDQNIGWTTASGLYIFSYLQANNTWFPLFVGQTDNFSTCLPNHERLDEAVELGATHIHTLVVPLAEQREYYEKGLIEYLLPPMNIKTH